MEIYIFGFMFMYGFLIVHGDISTWNLIVGCLIWPITLGGIVAQVFNEVGLVDKNVKDSTI